MNGCVGNMTEMTRRYNKIVGTVRRPIEEYKENILLSKIGDNIFNREEVLSKEA
jgi:hypothetical protein